MGSAAIGHIVASRQILKDQTLDFATQWVDLATSSQLEEAFLWTLSLRDRPTKEIPAAALLEANKHLQLAMTDTFSKAPLSDMVKRGKPKVSYHGVLTAYGASYDRVVVHEFHLEFDKGDPRQLEIAVAVNRQIDENEKIRFVVFKVTEVDNLIVTGN